MGRKEHDNENYPDEVGNTQAGTTVHRQIRDKDNSMMNYVHKNYVCLP